MDLTSALRVATHSLSNTSHQVSTISRNISGVGNPDYVRRDAQLKSGPLGYQTVDIVRRVDRSLSDALGVAASKEALQQVVVKGFDRLSILMGTNGAGGDFSASLGQLRDAIDLAAASPGNLTTLQSLVERARDVASGLNSAYSQILELKKEADAAARAGVDHINDILARIHDLNDQIVATTRTGEPDLGAMDQRDALVAELSQEIGLSVRHRADNDLAIYTNSGLTLFDRTPRSVEFTPIPSYGPTTTGNALYVDGVPATGNGSGLTVNSGNTIGHIQFRDDHASQQLARLDELARGLVEAFAETDQTGGGKPPLAGLFTWSGGPAVPASATLETGIAFSISVNPAVDPAAGGDMTLIRDGGISGDPDYIWNTSGADGFGDRLLALSEAMSTERSFDAGAGLFAQGGLMAFADALTGALEGDRSSHTERMEYRAELRIRLEESLRLETGPNLDYEMSQLLEVERAYQASAQLISAVDQMLETLMANLR